jgi:Protein of unknown function (DUF2971)
MIEVAKPRRLFYMTTLEVAESHILPERRMKLSTFDTLNDPLELLCAALGDRQKRKVFKAIRDHFTADTGLICMSDNWASPLMWAHYARSHTGVCLGFDIRADLPLQVHYEPERVRTLLNDIEPLHGLNEETMKTVLRTKYEAWSYEREWRLLAKLVHRDPKTGFFYVDFGPDMILREIIVGARCKRSVGALAKAVGKDVTHSVRVIKARPAFETFKMVQQQTVTPIYVHPR